MRRSRRAGVIVAVLLLLAIGVVIAASVLVSADAAAGSSLAAMERVQVRALAWSGAQGVMAELSQARPEILQGQDPSVTAEWDLFTQDDGIRGVVRLADLAPAEPGVAVPENAKLDINTATPEMLALVPGLSAPLAAKIVEARAKGPFASVEQLLTVEGIDPELLYGRMKPEEDSFAPAPEAVAPTAPGRGLREYLTVFSFDPNVRSGLDGESDAIGSPRVDLNREWSDEPTETVAELIGEEPAQKLRTMADAGRSFKTLGDLVSALIESGMPPEEWGVALDVFTTTPEPFLPGRVDINRAPAEVLACLPGITPETAGRIADVRATLDASMRRSLAWPVVEGILTPEEFAKVVDHITTRSTQWRVRIEAGIERAGVDGSAFAIGPALLPEDPAGALDAASAEESPLEHRMAFEAVVDIAEARPRLAYLREVTSLDPLLALLARGRSDPLDDLALEPRAPEASADPEAIPEEDPFLDGAADLDLSPGAAPEPPTDGAGEEEISPEPSAPPQNAEQTGGGDRRIGRWSTRRETDS